MVADIRREVEYECNHYELDITRLDGEESIDSETARKMRGRIIC